MLLGVIELGGVANRSAAGKLISDRSTHTDGGAVSTNRALAPGILPELNNSGSYAEMSHELSRFFTYRFERS